MIRWERLLYLPGAAAAILSQHAVTALAYWLSGRPLAADVGFWVAPVRAFGRLPLPDIAMPVAMAFVLASAGSAAWLSVRRARDAGRGHGLVMLTVVPILQVPAILILAVMPRSKAPSESRGEALAKPADVLAGMLAGAGLSVFAVFLAALVMGAYGWGLFVLAPFLAGGLTAYLANRRAVLDGTETFAAVFQALLLGALLLVAFALEGVVCLIMAAPLAVSCR